MKRQCDSFQTLHVHAQGLLATLKELALLHDSKHENASSRMHHSAKHFSYIATSTSTVNQHHTLPIPNSNSATSVAPRVVSIIYLLFLSFAYWFHPLIIHSRHFWVLTSSSISVTFLHIPSIPQRHLTMVLLYLQAQPV